ncbi:8627_t:CDS:1, partial [Racocetra fulgida]
CNPPPTHETDKRKHNQLLCETTNHIKQKRNQPPTYEIAIKRK